jgi:hypothetical protein
MFKAKKISNKKNQNKTKINNPKNGLSKTSRKFAFTQTI